MEEPVHQQYRSGRGLFLAVAGAGWMEGAAAVLLLLPPLNPFLTARSARRPIDSGKQSAACHKLC